MAVQTLRPAPSALPHADLAGARHGALGERWLAGMWRGDPVADAVVADGAGLVRAAIAQGVDAVEDAPPALRELFAQLDAPPPWLDRDRCDRAARHLVRQAREYGLVLGAASLLAGAANSVAGKPLAFTGRYAGNAAVRSIEVGSWLVAITVPGGLERFAPGFERTVRVRMIHAHVRAHLARHPDWDLDAWGVPIPQPYMAFTLAEFCSVALRAMAQLGARYDDAELADIVHLWRYVGHLVGVDAGLTPVTLDEYAAIEDLYTLTSPGPDARDREFIAALTTFQADELGRVLPRAWTPGIINGFQRAFVGDAAADALGIPDTRLKHLPRVLAPTTALVNDLHDTLVPAGRARRTGRAFRRREREMTRLRRAYGVDHELVDEVAG